MKILVIGDIHGRTIWEKIVDKHFNEVDKIIFLADYFDSRDGYKSKEIVENFRKIMLLRKQNPNKVVTLLGNHDLFQYCFGNNACSGYRDEIYFKLQQGKELEDLIKDKTLRIAYQYENFLFTHAGVSKTFYNKLEFKEDSVADTLNMYLDNKPNVFRFSELDYRSMVGEHIAQSPIWIRPYSLSRDKLEGYIHVVGHTHVENIDDTSYEDVVLCDSLGNRNYLIIDDVTINKCKYE